MGVSLPGGGGKRGLDFEINLVPFIDLLSCLISFLLITAVWTQLARIDVTQNTAKSSADSEPPEPKPQIKLLVDKDGYYIHLPTETGPRRIARDAGGEYKFWELEEGLKQMRSVDKTVTQVQLGGEDDVPYKEMVKVLDTCLGLELRELSMTPAALLRPPPGAGGPAPASAP